jgi:hypothetical protein
MPNKPANQHTGDYQHSRMAGALHDTAFGKMCPACHDGLHGKLCQGYGCECPCQRPNYKPKPAAGSEGQLGMRDVREPAKHKDE